MVEYLAEVKSDLAKPAKKLPLGELGRRMGIVSGIAEMPFVINVGLLFFNPEPWRFFKYTQIAPSHGATATGASASSSRSWTSPRDAALASQRSSAR